MPISIVDRNPISGDDNAVSTRMSPNVTVSTNIVMTLVGVVLATLMVWAGSTIAEASSSVKVLASQLSQLSTIQAQMSLQIERTTDGMAELKAQLARMEERVRLEALDRD